MTGDPSQFFKFKPKFCGKMTFGDDMRIKTIGLENIGKIDEILVHNILLQFSFDVSDILN